INSSTGNFVVTQGGAITAASINVGSGTVTAATVNATSAIQLNGANINTAGTLNNVAYLNQANVFSATNSFSSGSLDLTNATSNAIYFGNNGFAAPGNGSAGEKIQLYGNTLGTVASSDFALGVESNNLWLNTNVGIKFYKGASLQASLDTNGLWTLNNSGVSIAAGASYSGACAVTLSSANATALTLDSGTGTLSIAAGDTTLQRQASGTYTIDLSDSANTTLAVTNSNGGVASISIEATGSYTGAGAVNVSSAASGDLTLDSSSGTLKLGTNTSGVSFTNAGTATIQSTASRALTITGHASSIWSVDSGDLTVNAASNLNLGTTNTTSVTIGNTASNTAIALRSGNGTIDIGADNAAHTINLG